MTAAGLPVPPAFVLTTDVCRRFLATGPAVLDEIDAEIEHGLAYLEHATGRRFGAGAKPLLVSVRSGAPTSMPGMMDSVLDVGMDDVVERALAAEFGERFAHDTRARSVRSFTEVVTDTGSGLPVAPRRQLRAAIEAVFRSWLAPRAVTYRRRHRLDDRAGTAVTVQAMVFGNVDDRSGTGVLFTRDPVTGNPEPVGEWLPGAQGADLVSGGSAPRPLAALAESLPELHANLIEHARFLERDRRDVQDIEFTVEAGRLWLLQTRAAKRAPDAAVRLAVSLVRDGLRTEAEAVRMVTAEQLRALLRPRVSDSDRWSAPLLAVGEPACPGAGSGVVVDDPDEAVARAAEGAGVVLARATTSPHDVHGMMTASAVVTEVGGATSHAAVVCRELGVPCVVGCGEGSLSVLTGRTVTVCGETGEIRGGELPLRSTSEDGDPDLATLAAWAQEDSRADPG